MKRFSKIMKMLAHAKATGPNHHIIGHVERALLEQAMAEIGPSQNWPNDKRDAHHILNEGRSLVLRGPAHLDTALRGKYPDVERLVNETLRLGYGTVPGKIVAAALPPGARIKPHYDRGEYYKYHNRIHIPLVTNAGVYTTIGGDRFKMEAGHIYLFQNLRRHTAVNDSSVERIHLIVDVLDARYAAASYRRVHRCLMNMNLFWLGSLYRAMAALRYACRRP